MKEFILTGNTLLYTLVRCGGEYLYGLHAEIEDQSHDHLMQVASEAKAELVQKEYGEIDFDGNVTLRDEFRDAIGDCMNVDNVVAIDGKIKGEQRHWTLFCQKGTASGQKNSSQNSGAATVAENMPGGISATEKQSWGAEPTDNKNFWMLEQGQSDALYHLCYLSMAEFVERLGIDTAGHLSEETFNISSAILQKKDEQAIAASGCSGQCAELIIEALGERGNMIILQQIRDNTETELWRTFIFGGAGVLKMGLHYSADDEIVEFIASSLEEVQRTLTEALQYHD